VTKSWEGLSGKSGKIFEVVVAIFVLVNEMLLLVVHQSAGRFSGGHGQIRIDWPLSALNE
jgi:hypothetical protein